MTRRHSVWSGLAVSGAFLIAACASDASRSEDASAAAAPETITVFAAASLTDAFTQIGEDFEAVNEGVTVEFNFGASSDLVDSITGGDALGVADVFASADEANMDKLVDADDNESDPETFARNQAQIAVPAGNPAGIEGLDDFADDSRFIGLCAEDVPCGTYAREVLANAGVEPSIDTAEAKVTDVVAKVASGDLDAGIVYVTDVLANDDEVDGIEIADEFNVDAIYPIATVVESGASHTGTAFVDFVLSDAGQQVLRDFGFLAVS